MIHIPASYEQLRHEQIDDVHAEGLLLRHKKSGARIALLLNDDENKVFNIAFRTPPADSTGVAHILEHSVLCGSRKYPLKDPFVELAKGSLNTFLNAMTYPDKTMYPVASCNDADFRNLCDVYLDAVFYPRIHEEEKIFHQEGWHYQLENRDDPLKYNGVVYNEMKGAFSSSEELLARETFSALFPDTAYGVESGGDPDVIPELTYEDFLDFHKRYYHPSNSYIYFYGKIDAEAQLSWLDESYLSHFDEIDIDSSIAMQASFEGMRSLEKEYPVLDNEPLEDNSYLSLNLVAGDAMDVQQNLALTVLDYVLLSSPGAPIKQALLDAGIGKDVDGSYEDGILQPFFSIVARQANASDLPRFLAVIRETIEKICEEGIDEKALASGINYFEFRFREADYGGYPKGLIYGINLFSSWLYDDAKPFDYLRQLDLFAALKEKIGTGYFESLAKRFLLDNPHSVAMVLRPVRGLAAKREAALAEKLAAYKATLTEEEIDAIAAECAALRAYQEEEDDEETIRLLPQLKRSDIAKETPVRISNLRSEIDGTEVLQHDFFTNGIAYLNLYFDTSKVPDALIPYTGLLSGVLGLVSTEHFTYGELFHEINARTGGIFCGLSLFPDAGCEYGCQRFFGVRAKYLYPEQSFVFSMIREILERSELGDKKRLREIVASQKARLFAQLPAAGHISAVTRAMSYLSPQEAWTERTSGIAYYHFIEALEKAFDERADDLIEKLSLLMRYIFRPENLRVSVTADVEHFGSADKADASKMAELCDEIRALKEALRKEGTEELQADTEALQIEATPYQWKAEAKNEAWKTSGQVQYVASAGNFIQKGFAYTGALQILRTILAYDYLWMNIRVKGGAYGCMAAFQRNGAAYLTSYRDPHLAETYEIYRALPAYLSSFRADEHAMTKFVIGTISNLDTPLGAAAKGAISLNARYSGFDEAAFQKERDEILGADDAAIRALADLTEVVAKCEHICVIGTEAAIREEASSFGAVAPLTSS